jgi:galactokinase/mevalonate kinase-like predicted kinase
VNHQDRCVVRAPVRADLSAGFGDVAPFCLEAPGYVVNVALELTVDITIYRCPEKVPAGDGLPRRLLAETVEMLGIEGHYDLEVRTPGLVPGSGLGASGALSVGIAYAMLGWGRGQADPVDAAAVATTAVQAERLAGVHGGTQDQWASACGGVGMVWQSAERGGRKNHPSVAPSLAEHLVLVHPGGTRDSTAIIDAVTAASARKRNGAIVAEINAVAPLVDAALRRDDIATVGEFVNRSAALLARLDHRIVSETVHEVLDSARGVLGAKPCGAGGPSATWLVLVDPEARQDFARHIGVRGLTLLAGAPSSKGVRQPLRAAASSSSSAMMRELESIFSKPPMP